MTPNTPDEREHTSESGDSVQISRSDDGSVTITAYGPGEFDVHVDPNTETGAAIIQFAEQQGKDPGEAVHDAIAEFLESERE